MSPRHALISPGVLAFCQTSGVCDGEQVVVNTFGPTDFFGELAMLSDEPRTASVVATEDAECLVLTRWEFLGKLKADSEMSVVILQELAKRFQRALGVL